MQWLNRNQVLERRLPEELELGLVVGLQALKLQREC
jgi:hypothetical protein